MNTSLEVVNAGVATTIQDLGRPGWAHVGVPASGAVDPGLLALLNRLLGNAEGAAAVETCGELTIRANGPVTVATSVAPAPTALREGDELTVRSDGRRLWHYLAVRGGVDVDPVLGSRSRDTLSAIGPPPLRAGDTVRVGDEPGAPILADVAPLGDPGSDVRLTAGPRAEWFADDWSELVTSTPWKVTATSRVGVRLRGVPLIRVVEGELPSEGLVRGALQSPPDGDLVMMLADHPTTGGYPVIAVVDPDDVAALAQHAAGTTVRFGIT